MGPFAKTPTLPIFIIKIQGNFRKIRCLSTNRFTENFQNFSPAQAGQCREINDNYGGVKNIVVTKNKNKKKNKKQKTNSTI